jgi:3-oxoacyl-[acyl-carrier protein] reductase
MDLGLHGKVALVTGASRGIGLAVAKTLAEEGCSVGLVARESEDLRKAEADMAKSGTPALAIAGDVMVPSDVKLAVERVSRAFGPVEILINNAGGGPGFRVGFDEVKDEDWLAMFELNLLSTVRFTRAVLPGMLKMNRGSIVMVSTDAAAQPERYVPHYSVAKAGVLNLAKSLSRKYGSDGIRVNTVSPGMIRTTQLGHFLEQQAHEQGKTIDEVERALVQQSRPDITARRAGTPEEVAAVIAFLASPRASYVNGANIRVDSGEVLSIT